MTAASILAVPAGVTAVGQAVWLLTAPVRLLLALVAVLAVHHDRQGGYRPRHAARGRYVGRHLAPALSAADSTGAIRALRALRGVSAGDRAD